jgi:uncharacterized YkwD family protein
MKHFGKSLIAIALGLALTGISSSAFAASACPFKPNNTVTYKWFPYVLVYPQYQQAPVYYLTPNYTVPKQYYSVPKQNYTVPKQTVQRPVYSKAPAAKQTAPKQVQKADQFASQVVALVNQERAKAGLKPLQADRALTAVALDKAIDMHNNHYFSHNSPTYGSPFDMMRKYGISFRTAGENIAMGQRSPQEVMNQWMNSKGHRANILNPNFTKIGVAHYNGYWVQEFTG